MKKALLWLLGVVCFLFVLTVYVGATAGRELLQARAALSGVSVDSLDRQDVVDARSHFLRAQDHLSSLPARVLGLVPVARQNIHAVRSLSASVRPVLDAALELDVILDDTEEAGLLRGGRVNLQAISELRGPLELEVQALRDFIAEVDQAKSGWLLPSVWTQLDELSRRFTPAADAAENLIGLLESAPDFFGVTRDRSYLVLLMNNAELRGAGGILSGVGELQLRDGRIHLGSFRSVHALRDHPPERVRAPEDYERRFATYKANTTLWLNTTFSPDIPDVAQVAARLFRKKTGIETHGAILADPRGVAALADPETPVAIPDLDLEIPRDGLADFIYSDVYARFEDQARRRAAILQTGQRVFAELASGGLGAERLEDLGAALNGGHLRVVSFDADEQQRLADLGIAGELTPPPGVSAIGVTVQNLGSGDGEGTKLDFWVDRHVEQGCSLAAETATCATGVQLRNDAPAGLAEYVAGEPYGIVRSYLEVYLPDRARVDSVTLDGRPAKVRVDKEEGQQVLGVYVELGRGELAEVRADYTIPNTRAGLHLVLRPQPLSRDGRLALSLQAPRGWDVRASDGSPLDDPLVKTWAGTVEVTAGPTDRSGIPAWWEGFKRFWEEPLF